MTIIISGVLAAAIVTATLATAAFVNVAFFKQPPSVVQPSEFDRTDKELFASAHSINAAVQEQKESATRHQSRRSIPRTFWFVDIFLIVSLTALTLQVV